MIFDYDWIAWGLTAVILAWTLLPLVPSDIWWVRAFEFPRVQLTILTALLGVASVDLGGVEGPEDWARGLIALACVGYQAWRIWPYTPLHPKQMPDAGPSGPEEGQRDEVKILVANVLMTNRNAQGLLKIIRDADPDLVLTVEGDRWWQEQLEVLEADYPLSIKHPLDSTYGMHFFSRLKLHDARLEFLVEEGIPSIHGDLELPSGRTVELHCLHPSPPVPQFNDSSAERDGELLVVAKAIRKSGQPAIVTGDLNDVAWSASTLLCQKVGNLLDPRIGRGPFNTFHADHWYLRWPLDHIFTTAEFRLVDLKRLPAFGSDHFPILAHLRYVPAAPEPEEPEADGEEKEEAEEKIEEVDAKEPT